MTCDDCAERIDDLDDGRLSLAETAAVRRHLSACRTCSALAVDVARIRAAALTLGPVEPPARVWTQVAAAVASRPAAEPTGDAGPGWHQWLAAAASVVLVATSLAWVGSKLTSSAMPPGGAAASVEPSEQFQLAEAAYQSAIDSLEPIAEETEAPVLTEPALVAVHASLDALDQTIGEARQRLTQEPDDQISQDLLLSALESKVALLQDTVALLDESATTGVNQ